MRANPKPPSEDPVAEPQAESDDAVIGQALRWSLGVIAVGLCIAAGVVFWVTRPAPLEEVVEAEVVVPKLREQPQAEPPVVPFRDVTRDAGIEFIHENGARGDKLLPETMGGGCAFFDYDGDLDQDLLLVNSRGWPWDDDGERQAAATPALYENDGEGRFRDITQQAGLDFSLYGMGVAVADYDHDGDPDIFLSAVGPNRLLRNDDGRYVDVTEEAGVAGDAEAWGTSCCWFDYDNDGLLDLFVCNYVRWSRDIDQNQDFRLVGVGRAYGPPKAFQGSFPTLYRNTGEGRFIDVSEKAGIQIANPANGVPMAKSLGVSPIDIDRDGWMDLIVANDTVQNFLFHNQQDGSFEEIGALAGIAFDANGEARGAMGTDVGFTRNDDTLAISIGNFSNEMTAYYCASEDPLQFVDAAIANGLGPATRLVLTFGLFFFDYDLDSRLDLLCANGHLEEEINKVQASQHYAQPPQLFWNAGADSRTEFVAVSPDHVGEEFHQPIVGRGAAFADIDRDGDLDVLLTTVGSTPRLFRNEQQLGHHWLRLRLIGEDRNRDAIGAWVELEVQGMRLRRQVMPTRSYLSQSELPVTFGLGAATEIDRCTVTWPGGEEQEVEITQVDTELEVRRSVD